ncbi:MAG: class I SAM-dependent methyltransferase [Lachnospiraceae bacterium]|nr:class I SAM-dependent methyltransferase [Lachnospiraceae bacterium]
MDYKRLAEIYGECWGGEAGEWNTSLANKYLEFKITGFFEENFTVKPDFNILNVGIGTGYWDRYLSFKVPEGSLTSIDIDKECADNFKCCLQNENNIGRVTIICDDAAKHVFEKKFDLITIIGSTAEESGNAEGLIKNAMSFLKDDGALYLQVFCRDPKTDVKRMVDRLGMETETELSDDTYGIPCRYYKLKK